MDYINLFLEQQFMDKVKFLAHFNVIQGIIKKEKISHTYIYTQYTHVNNL